MVSSQITGIIIIQIVHSFFFFFNTKLIVAKIYCGP